MSSSYSVILLFLLCFVPWYWFLTISRFAASNDKFWNTAVRKVQQPLEPLLAAAMSHSLSPSQTVALDYAKSTFQFGEKMFQSDELTANEIVRGLLFGLAVRASPNIAKASYASLLCCLSLLVLSSLSPLGLPCC
jgi:hypothetical protein